jgi:hypothetical protein
MKSKPSMMTLRGLLFVFDIENTQDPKREEIIVSKNINVDAELVELFDALIRPRFSIYQSGGKKKIIDAITYYLAVGDDFDELFRYMDTYFDQGIEDQLHFMKVLLGCLERYQLETKCGSDENEFCRGT